MTNLRAVWPLVLAASLVTSAVSGEQTQRTNSATRITVMKHCLQPLGTFEIVGTDVKGVGKLEELTEVLRNHKKQIQKPATRFWQR